MNQQQAVMIAEKDSTNMSNDMKNTVSRLRQAETALEEELVVTHKVR